MKPDENPELAALIERCSSFLFAEAFARSGTDQIPMVAGDLRMRGPTARPGSKLGDIDLNNLARLLYTKHQPSDAIVTAWDESIAFFQEKVGTAEVVAPLHAVQPLLPVTNHRSGITALHALTLFLWANCEAGKFQITGRRVNLELGSINIGLNSRGIFTSTGWERPRRSVFHNYVTSLTEPIGQPQLASRATASALEGLKKILPLRTRAIQVVFATAIAAGREFEDLLVRPWYVIDRGIDGSRNDPNSAVWNRALDLVTHAAVSPLPGLYGLMSHLMNVSTFTRMFGNPRVESSGSYTQHSRGKHISALQALRSGEVQLNFLYVPPKADRIASESEASAAELLQLQQLIGS